VARRRAKSARLQDDPTRRGDDACAHHTVASHTVASHTVATCGLRCVRERSSESHLRSMYRARTLSTATSDHGSVGVFVLNQLHVSRPTTRVHISIMGWQTQGSGSPTEGKRGGRLSSAASVVVSPSSGACHAADRLRCPLAARGPTLRRSTLRAGGGPRTLRLSPRTFLCTEQSPTPDRGSTGQPRPRAGHARPLRARGESCQSSTGAPRAAICGSLPLPSTENAAQRTLRCPLCAAQWAQAPGGNGVGVHRQLFFGGVVRRVPASGRARVWCGANAGAVASEFWRGVACGARSDVATAGRPPTMWWV